MAIAHNGRVQYWHISILELQMSQRCQLLTAELSKYELLRRIIEEPNLRSRPNLNWRIVANALTEILQNSAFWTYYRLLGNYWKKLPVGRQFDRNGSISACPDCN